MAAQVAISAPEVKHETKTATLTPPASEESEHKNDGHETSSDLSDLEFDDDNEGTQREGAEEEGYKPDHYYGGGRIPVFKPTMDQFRDFNSYVSKIDKYGMKSGIVKVVPPKEWRDSLPALDQSVKTIKVKNPIMQDFTGRFGVYTVDIREKQRSYNLPQWKELCEESHHLPPGIPSERSNAPRVTRSAPPKAKKTPLPMPEGQKRKPGRPRVKPLKEKPTKEETPKESTDGEPQPEVMKVEGPLTPTSPDTLALKVATEDSATKERTPLLKPQDRLPGRQPKSKSVSQRRRYNQRDEADVIDEKAFENFDYRHRKLDVYTAEKCEDLEKRYWKGILSTTPMYGADMPGSLFDDSTTSWNVDKLENLLNLMDRKVPGVNTTYLYLGMWAASFAWHVEDMNLYSINYIHFGAPKQWYSISQEDAARFEAALKKLWPNDAKQCNEFLRHKTYLISPPKIAELAGITVNKMVHNEGEFVLTFPRGYHSGFNLGYNCAESVNFALEGWIPYGKEAKACACESWSATVNVDQIERRMHGIPTPVSSPRGTPRSDLDSYSDSDDEADPDDPLTPQSSVRGKVKKSSKRKREGDAQRPKIKRIKFRMPHQEPCVLCPNDTGDQLLNTDNGHQAHRLCALYTPETYIEEENGVETVYGIARIDKARLDLKCLECRLRKGSCFQCSANKCPRAYHATCAYSAGVQVDSRPVPVFHDGVEYTDQGFDFRCKYHRPRRPKNVGITTLREDPFIESEASKLKLNDWVQYQDPEAQDILAGRVVENRNDEKVVLIRTMATNNSVQIEYSWFLFLNPDDSYLPKPSANATPLPRHLMKQSSTMEQSTDRRPAPGDHFHDPQYDFVWKEFECKEPAKNPCQQRVDFSKPNRIWHYLGKTSTDSKAQYTEDLAKPRHNLASVFLETVKASDRPKYPLLPPVKRPSLAATYPNYNQAARNAAMVNSRQHQQVQARPERPYQYRPKDMPRAAVDQDSLMKQRQFQQQANYPYNWDGQPQPYGPKSPLGIAPHGYNYGHAASPPLPDANWQHSPTAPHHPSISSDQLRSMRDPYGAYQERQRIEAIRREANHPPRQASPSSSMSAWPPVTQHSRAQNPAPMRPPQTPHTTARASNVISNASPHELPTKIPDHIQKYPYLVNAYLTQPRCYDSPYATDGGFTTNWLPAPEKPSLRPRAPSLSQDYYKNLPPVDQDKIKQECSSKSPTSGSPAPKVNEAHQWNSGPSPTSSSPPAGFGFGRSVSMQNPPLMPPLQMPSSSMSMPSIPAMSSFDMPHGMKPNPYHHTNTNLNVNSHPEYAHFVSSNELTSGYTHTNTNPNLPHPQHQSDSDFAMQVKREAEALPRGFVEGAGEFYPRAPQTIPRPPHQPQQQQWPMSQLQPQHHPEQQHVGSGDHQQQGYTDWFAEGGKMEGFA